MIESIPVPGINDFDEIFWLNCSNNQLSIQHCGACDEPRFPPRHMCPKCQSIDHKWKIVAGDGELWSYVIPRAPLLPYFEKQSPYIVGLVALNNYTNIRIIGRIMNSDGTNLVSTTNIAIGSKISVGFNKINSEITIPFWFLDV
jgi:uncharacterized OB-fold protein